MRILLASAQARSVSAWAEVLKLEPAFEVDTVTGDAAAVEAALDVQPPDLAMIDLMPGPGSSPTSSASWRPPSALVSPLFDEAAPPAPTRSVLAVQDAQEAAPLSLAAVEVWAASRPRTDFLVASAETGPDALLRAMRAGVREVLPGPAAPEAVLAALRRQMRKRQPGLESPSRHVAEVVSVVSCKGGSGSTFVAANLAHGLTRGGQRRVLLIDLNLQFGDAALFLSNRAPERHLADVARDIARLDADLLRASVTEVAPGLAVLAAPEDPALAADVSPAHVRRIVQLARATHDHVVIDVGRALSPVTLQALDLADRVFAVLQLTLPFIRDAQRLKRVFASLDYPRDKIRWVVNRHQRDGSITVADLERALGTDRIATLPNQYDVVAAAVNQGLPVAEVDPRSAIARGLALLAAELLPGEPALAPRWRWGGWFRGATAMNRA
jgi:pilus assembly protein CpaE